MSLREIVSSKSSSHIFGNLFPFRQLHWFKFFGDSKLMKSIIYRFYSCIYIQPSSFSSCEELIEEQNFRDLSILTVHMVLKSINRCDQGKGVSILSSH